VQQGNRTVIESARYSFGNELGDASLPFLSRSWPKRRRAF
jgi:hypothetical protein